MFKRVMPWFWMAYFSIRYPEAAPYIISVGLAVLAIWAVRSHTRGRISPAPAAVPDSTGILFLEGGEPLPTDSRCITCRHPLARDVIYCVKCHTPHHRDCFRYVGACSVYACRNRAA